MTKQEKYNALKKAYSLKEGKMEGEKDIYISNNEYWKNDTLATIFNIQKEVEEDSRAGFDLSYEIMSKACDVITDTAFDELEDATFESEQSSVYTDDRLGYLNHNNQFDILDIINDYKTNSIDLACAIWYDNAVNDACYRLKNWIFNQ